MTTATDHITRRGWTPDLTPPPRARAILPKVRAQDQLLTPPRRSNSPSHHNSPAGASPCTTSSGSYPTPPTTTLRTISPLSLPSMLLTYQFPNRCIRPRTQPTRWTPYSLKPTRQPTLLTHLTAPNPTINLLLNPSTSQAETRSFWFDIRNIRPWDFNPPPNPTLKTPLPLAAAPQNGPYTPRSESHLAEILQSTILATLPHNIPIQREGSLLLLHPSRDFNILNKPTCVLVGLVKPFFTWNSGMFSPSSPADAEKRRYLAGLAELQYAMRQHGTSYGFVISEVETVAVRLRRGGGNFPHRGSVFGGLDVAGAVRFGEGGREGGRGEKGRDASRTSGSSGSIFGCMGVRSARLSGPRGSVNYSAGTRQDHAGMDAPLNAPLTAPLAIWYLYHLSLQEGPADVTVPKERSRRFHYQRDENLPMPSVKEERAAKRIRGWVWPGERFSVKEKEM